MSEKENTRCPSAASINAAWVTTGAAICHCHRPALCRYLIVRAGVPVRIVDDHAVRAGQRDAKAARLRGQQKTVDRRVRVELGDQPLPLGGLEHVAVDATGGRGRSKPGETFNEKIEMIEMYFN